MSSFSRAHQQWATFARVWYLLDGKMQPPGKLAALASVKLQGLHKPMYHPLSDCGDHIVIINTRHIAFSGNKWEQKVYSSHTGYPGGFKQVTAAQLHRQDPVAIVKLAVYGMLPKNLHRRTMMQRLHLFPDETVPEDILQNVAEELPQPRKVPRRLDEYTREEVEAFPRLWTPPVAQGQGNKRKGAVTLPPCYTDGWTDGLQPKACVMSQGPWGAQPRHIHLHNGNDPKVKLPFHCLPEDFRM